jgi:hypothetical protein
MASNTGHTWTLDSLEIIFKVLLLKHLKVNVEWMFIPSVFVFEIQNEHQSINQSTPKWNTMLNPPVRGLKIYKIKNKSQILDNV